ncbi:tetratricopeptide repeat protein [Brachyspira catarrhinii]|uniref:Tetratricopeptide repeat protein n=1 Tax=Brachyspira catarrhinii TaxID=2528966 RepID=A0ABY2TS97_9SPIR|nr:tetratricopeptide repeat protein [Brachyspira catarrhinii]TKZ35695.1 tetratricopeptide repeat protein [Brachyspira catarrhinii]
MIIRKKLLFILFIFWTINLYSFSLDELTAKLDVDRANRLFKNGNYESAITLYEKALSKVTNSPQIYYNMGTTMASVGEMDTAIQLFDMAKNNFNEKTSKSIKHSTYYNSGIAKIENEDYQGAIDELIDALVHNPKDENSKRALEYARKKLEEQKNNSGPSSQNSPNEDEGGEGEGGNSGDNSDNNNQNNEDNKSDNSDNNSNDENENNERENEKSDIDRLLESLRQYRKDKNNEEQYYGGGRIDKDW